MVEHPAAHPFLLRLARRLLTKAEQSVGTRAVRLKLDRREAPELYAQTDAEQIQRLVLLLEDWCRTGWVTLSLGRPREFAGFVDRNPQIELQDFDALAAWAGYEPRSTQWQRQWLTYLEARWPDSPDGPFANRRELLDYLARNPLLALQSLPLDEAARSLEALQTLCTSRLALPLREASARVFQGRSKVLDNRDELLRLLGAAPGQFQEAPIQLLLDVPVSFNEALFVENLVTFERMADLRQPAWQRSLLIYAAGFKGSARRLRTRQGCRLYVRAMRSTESATRVPANSGLLDVEDWLFGGSALPVRFFGDLDYSGMRILASLREVFGDAQAWPLGYGLLAEVIEQGGGHPPQLAAKEQQTDPGAVGCSYADQLLLPLIRRYERFIDQEVFQPCAD